MTRAAAPPEPAMTLANNTPFAAEAIPLFGPDGREIVLVVVKATFVREGAEAVRAAEQSPVRLGDVPHVPSDSGFAPNGPFQASRVPGKPGPPYEVSLRYPSDVVLAKQGMDLLFVADAVSRTPVRALDVAFSVAERSVALRVHGERVFDRSRGALGFGPAVPFERRPIVWELAYGGTSDDFSRVERRNPVGRGLEGSDLVGKPAPCIEDPAHPLSPGHATEPVGVGAVASHWAPRSEHAGTFDESWRAERMPLPPLDASVQAGNVAAAALQLPRAPEPGTRVAALGVSPDGLWSFALPRLELVVRGKTKDGRTIVARPVVDTLLCEPDTETIELTARVALPMGRGKALLAEVQIDV